ncbi:MAG: hypothetical protein ACYC2K_03480, partial [Gemmatimonadales bacterium]
MVRPLMLLVGLLSGCASDEGSSGPEPEGTRYTIELTLDPRAEQLAAEVQVDLPSRVSGEPLEFLLHGDLELSEVSGPDVERVDTVPGFNPFGLPESHLRLVTLHLKPGAGPTRLSWRYSGWIAPDRVQLGPDAFYPDWIELDVGSAWIPIRRTMTERFTYRAEVTVPDGYEVIGAGTRRHSGGVWHFETEQPFLTASLAVAPAMHS